MVSKTMNWGGSRTILRVDVSLLSYGSAQFAPQQIKSGIPQGSILGPILFSIYINDLPNCFLQSKIILYADDAVLFYADSKIGNISTVLNKNLKQLQSWTYLNKLCIHPVKTECVLFGTQPRIASASLLGGPFSLFHGAKPINQAQHYKYLSLLIDANLNFKQHVDKLQQLKYICSGWFCLHNVKGSWGSIAF